MIFLRARAVFHTIMDIREFRIVLAVTSESKYLNHYTKKWLRVETPHAPHCSCGKMGVSSSTHQLPLFVVLLRHPFSYQFGFTLSVFFQTLFRALCQGFSCALHGHEPSRHRHSGLSSQVSHLTLIGSLQDRAQHSAPTTPGQDLGSRDTP